jgi:hypothetical protein
MRRGQSARSFRCFVVLVLNMRLQLGLDDTGGAAAPPGQSSAWRVRFQRSDVVAAALPQALNLNHRRDRALRLPDLKRIRSAASGCKPASELDEDCCRCISIPKRPGWCERASADCPSPTGKRSHADSEESVRSKHMQSPCSKLFENP